MIDVKKMIAKRYPKLKNNTIIQKSLEKIAASLIHQEEINAFLKKHAHLGSFEFIDEVLEHFNFTFDVKDKYIENIPATGRVVIIANHPLGGLDALSLIKLVSSVRKDIKVVANDFLDVFTPLQPILLNINNFKSLQRKEAIKKVYESLNNDEAVIIFPSGEVSRATSFGIKDKKWNKGFLKFAQRSHSPILPVFIGGKNSKTFYSVSAINKKLSTTLLAHEMFKQQNKSIPIHVGEVIPNENIIPNGIQIDRLIELYKKHVYNITKGKSFFLTQKAIAHPENSKDIKKELKKCELLSTTKEGKKIYLFASDDKNSIVINELGRLRELSFRKVGEGVNKKRDIDKYDRYYKHIILWDDEELEIVGAYRIAEVEGIIKNEGVGALYTTTLFEFNHKFEPYLKNSIELGRSFVQPKYWGSKALDYLWFGIGAYLYRHPEIKYMFGPVSLSAGYSKITKDIILYFYDRNFGAPKRLVDAKLPYNFATDKDLMESLRYEFNDSDYKKNFKTLKRILSGLNASVPTLYKQYSDLCEEGGIQFCAYNVDVDFSNCVDSFIIVEVDKIKEAQRKRYISQD